MKQKIFTICSLLIIFPVWSFGQNVPANPTPANTPNTARITGVSVLKNRPFSPFRKKPTREQRKQLQPKQEDLTKYAQFLLQPNTGMFRLLPDPGCEDNALVVRVDEICRNAIPDSSFYSFRETEHTSDILADIRLKNEFLISDGVLAQGIMVKLGDVPVETVTLSTDGLKFINEYVPQTNSKEAHKQSLQMNDGVRAGKHEYRRAVFARENTTYALRVIAYRGNLYRTYRGFLYDLLAGDKRIDLTLAFRVIRKETDGSLTLLWKELHRKESPKLKRSKKNQNNQKG